MVTTQSKLHRRWQATALRWTCVLSILALVDAPCRVVTRHPLYSARQPPWISRRRAILQHGSGERRGEIHSRSAALEHFIEGRNAHRRSRLSAAAQAARSAPSLGWAQPPSGASSI